MADNRDLSVEIPLGGAFATNRIAKEGKRILFMYREAPDHDHDSGWRFFSGEDQAYVDDPANLAIYALSTIAAIDPDIVPFLNKPAPCAFERERADMAFKPSEAFNFQPEED